jgi:hypothetical protein
MWPKYGRIPKLFYFPLRPTCSQIWLNPLLDDSSDLLSHKIKLKKENKRMVKSCQKNWRFFFLVVVQNLRNFFSIVNSTNFLILFRKNKLPKFQYISPNWKKKKPCHKLKPTIVQILNIP